HPQTGTDSKSAVCSRKLTPSGKKRAQPPRAVLKYSSSVRLWIRRPGAWSAKHRFCKTPVRLAAQCARDRRTRASSLLVSGRGRHLPPGARPTVRAGVRLEYWFSIFGSTKPGARLLSRFKLLLQNEVSTMGNDENSGRSAVLPLPPLLITESDEEFNRIRKAPHEEIKPVGIIEQMYVDEIADLVWQILRLKRCKAGVINLAFHQSSAKILGSSWKQDPMWRATGFPVRRSPSRSRTGWPPINSTGRSLSRTPSNRSPMTSSRSTPCSYSWR